MADYYRSKPKHQKQIDSLILLSKMTECMFYREPEWKYNTEIIGTGYYFGGEREIRSSCKKWFALTGSEHEWKLVSGKPKI